MTAYRELTLDTPGGPVSVRHYAPVRVDRAAIWVGGIGGGWDTPARGLYPALAESLVDEGIASLRVRFRDPTGLSDCVDDVLAGVAFLQADGVRALALVGHSFGGAVVLNAAIATPAARAVVTLATQSYGVGDVASLAPRCALLVVHGTADEILPAPCSRTVFDAAREPKWLALYPGAGHVLDEAADELRVLVRGWIVDRL